MNKRIYILTLLLITFLGLKAQEKKYVYQDSAYVDEEITTVTDTIIYAPPKIVEEIKEDYNADEDNVQYIDTALYANDILLDKDSVSQLKNNKAFAYVKYLDSLLKEQQKKKVDNKPKKQRESIDVSWLNRILSSSFLKILLWTLAIAFVLFIIFKLFFTKGAFQRNFKKQENVKEEIQEEEINADTNFDKLIQQAEKDNNYRLAVRYSYLKALHTLANQAVVQLAPDKTNYQYVQEISNENVRNSFAKITLNYEYVWYGEFEIDELIYQQVKNTFKNFQV